jgi:transcription-repair coupling factor (superfamily II helicase)
MDAYIDTSFIGDESQKIEVYKRIAAIRDLRDMYDIEEEIEDRFGDIPESLRNLLEIAYIKVLASTAGAVSIAQKEALINIHFSENRLKPEAIMLLVDKFGKYVSFSASKTPFFSIKASGLKNSEVLKLLREMMEAINSLQ